MNWYDVGYAAGPWFLGVMAFSLLSVGITVSAVNLKGGFTVVDTVDGPRWEWEQPVFSKPSSTTERVEEHCS